MSELLTAVARLRAKPGQEAQLRRELQRLVAPTREEAGCVTYDLHESMGEPGCFLFYEVWKSPADLEAHFQTPHMLSIAKVLPELLAEPMDLTKWTIFVGGFSSGGVFLAGSQKSLTSKEVSYKCTARAQCGTDDW